MSARRTKSNKPQVQHAGRVTLTECKVRGDDQPCAPINRVTLYRPDGKVREHCTCSCGRRFTTTHEDAPEHLVEPLGPPTGPPEPGGSETWRIAAVHPADAVEERAAVGIVPVGTAVLHRPTQPVGVVTDDVRALAKHMIKVMAAAPGVGVAANQVGVPLRLFVQLHKRAVPETLIDPEIRATEGSWDFTEGCLSIEVDGSHTALRRPSRIQVRARTLHGEVVEITADEVVARILQHEIDHLDGITYVQRLTGEAHDHVYALLAEDGVDTSAIPPRPY